MALLEEQGMDGLVPHSTPACSTLLVLNMLRYLTAYLHFCIIHTRHMLFVICVSGMYVIVSYFFQLFCSYGLFSAKR